MELSRRTLTVYTLLAAVWALVLVWQAEEHYRFRTAAKADLSNRSRDIANTVSACIRGMRFRGAVLQERLEPVLNELVNGRSNAVVKPSEVTSIVLLNAAGERIAEAGRRLDLEQLDIVQQGEHWGQGSVVFVNLVDLGSTDQWEGGTNPTVVLPRLSEFTNTFPDSMRNRERREPGLDPPRHEGAPPEPGQARESSGNAGPPPEPRPREPGPRPRRPPWLRGLSESDYQALIQRRALHDLVLAMSVDSFHVASARDLWLRLIIVFLATVSAVGR